MFRVEGITEFAVGLRATAVQAAWCLLLTRAAVGATLNVPADFPTIQACIDAAVDGADICLVAPGTYPETINFLGKAMVSVTISEFAHRDAFGSVPVRRVGWHDDGPGRCRRVG